MWKGILRRQWVERVVGKCTLQDQEEGFALIILLYIILYNLTLHYLFGASMKANKKSGCNLQLSNDNK